MSAPRERLVSGTMTFAAGTIRSAFDAARRTGGTDRAAAAAVVAALLPHVETDERTITESIATLVTCIEDVAAVEPLARALTARLRDDSRLALSVARAARRAFELGAHRSLAVLLDVLLSSSESAVLVEEAWRAAVLPTFDVDEEKTDLHPASFFRARHAELVALESAAASAERLGRYRLVEELGRGGMGTVHLARLEGHAGFATWVAIKRLHGYIQEDDACVQMFLAEARIASVIPHPNVATFLELGKSDDGYWIAMEYLHGEPLSVWLRRTRANGCALPPELACSIIADAAAGLHAAHELTGPNGESLGIVHRDVTPQNLFVTFDGITKVLDFGLAKLAASDTRCGRPSLAGKVAYMSPEQVRGEVIDRRTDVFALGVVLWELTTGRRLFRRQGDLETLTEVLACAPPPPSTLVRNYPADVERIVMKALAKDRSERFADARQLSRALRTVLSQRNVLVGAEEVGTHARLLLADRVRARDAALARYTTSKL